MQRTACAGDRRATMAELTDAGMKKLEEAAPGHVEAVGEYVIDALTSEQIEQLRGIFETVFHGLDPDGEMREITGRRREPGK